MRGTVSLLVFADGVLLVVFLFVESVNCTTAFLKAATTNEMTGCILMIAEKESIGLVKNRSV